MCEQRDSDRRAAIERHAHLKQRILVEHDGGAAQEELACDVHEPPQVAMRLEVAVQLLEPSAHRKVRVRRRRVPKGLLAKLQHTHCT